MKMREDMMMTVRTCILMIAVLALGACSGSDTPRLMNAAAQNREPDEFGILPTKPLEMPDNLSQLPAPKPGGTNRVDPQPRADVARALGGNPARAVSGGSVDGGIVNYAARFGRADGIRDQLAAEDLQFRRDNDGRLLERLFAVNVYHKAYQGMWLDKYAELDRWRRAGAQTPSAPPENRQAK